MLRGTFQSRVALGMALSLATSSALAQSELGTSMKRSYRLRSVACHACHIKEEEEKTRTALTNFGKVTAQLVEGKMVTERLDAAEAGEKEEKEKVQEAIEQEFAEALKKLDTLQVPDGRPWSDLIRVGEIDGIKTRN